MGFFRSSGIVNGKGFFGAVSQAQAFVPTDISGCKLWVSMDYGITTGSVSFINQIVVSGCDPYTSDGTYIREFGGNASLNDGSTGNNIYYEDGVWYLYDIVADSPTFANYSGLESYNTWEVFSGSEFGTATNSSTTVNDVVTQIDDRSGNSNNLIQSYKNAFITNSVINSKPAILFEGPTFEGTDIVTGKTLYAVIKTTANIQTGYAVIIETTGGGIYSSVAPRWGSYFNNSYYVDNALSANSSYILGSISDDGNNYEFRQNGSTAKTGTDGQGFLSRSALYFGNDSSNGQPSNCYVAEGIVYDRAITTSEAGQLESYLNAKYAIY